MRAPGSSSPGLLDRVLDDHADALFDFALAVTAGSEGAVEAVRDAAPAALEAHGPAVSRALLGSVLEAALRRAEPPGTLPDDLLEPGPGSHDDLRRVSRDATRALDPRQRGVLGPFATPGDVSWSVTVTDIRGNTTVSSPEVLRVQPC